MSNIYVIKMFGRSIITNQTCLNVYHFQSNIAFVTTIEDLTELLEGFISSREAFILGVLNISYQLVSYSAGDIVTGLEIIKSVGAGFFGARVGEAAPAQLAFSFKLVRTFPDTKSGGKRYSPISETDVGADGALQGPTIQTPVNALQQALIDPIPLPAQGDSVQAIILGTIKDKLPVLIPNPIAQAVFIEATTQKTRQRGRGS